MSVAHRELTILNLNPHVTTFFPPFFKRALLATLSFRVSTTGHSSSSVVVVLAGKNKRCDRDVKATFLVTHRNIGALALLYCEDKTSACSKARSGNNYNKHQQKKTTTMAETFPRINGGMIQSGQFTGQLVSLVGKLVSHDKIQAADGTVVTLKTDSMNEQPIVNPDMVVEVMGQPSDETTFTVRRYYYSI